MYYYTVEAMKDILVASPVPKGTSMKRTIVLSGSGWEVTALTVTVVLPLDSNTEYVAGTNDIVMTTE